MSSTIIPVKGVNIGNILLSDNDNNISGYYVPIQFHVDFFEKNTITVKLNYGIDNYILDASTPYVIYPSSSSILKESNSNTDLTNIKYIRLLDSTDETFLQYFIKNYPRNNIYNITNYTMTLRFLADRFESTADKPFDIVRGYTTKPIQEQPSYDQIIYESMMVEQIEYEPNVYHGCTYY